MPDLPKTFRSKNLFLIYLYYADGSKDRCRFSSETEARIFKKNCVMLMDSKIKETDYWTITSVIFSPAFS